MSEWKGKKQERIRVAIIERLGNGREQEWLSWKVILNQKEVWNKNGDI